MELATYDFDPVLGQWKTQSLGTGFTENFGATIAADSKGGVGAAWVQYTRPQDSGRTAYVCL